jgi:hypothetical protein
MPRLKETRLRATLPHTTRWSVSLMGMVYAGEAADEIAFPLASLPRQAQATAG